VMEWGFGPGFWVWDALLGLRAGLGWSGDLALVLGWV